MVHCCLSPVAGVAVVVVGAEVSVFVMDNTARQCEVYTLVLVVDLMPAVGKAVVGRVLVVAEAVWVSQEAWSVVAMALMEALLAVLEGRPD